jgi:hypothetical protein
MKFKYNLSKKNYERIVRRTNSKNNGYYVLISSLVYLYFVRDLILDNFLLMLCFYLIAVIIIYFAVELVTILTSKLLVKMNEKSLGIKYGTYDCSLTKEKFTEKLGDTEISILLKDIIKTKQTDRNYEILTSKMIVVFNKQLFEKVEDYDKVVEFIKNNIPKQNKK